MATTVSWLEYFSIITVPFLVKLSVATAIIIITKIITSTLTPIIIDSCRRYNLDQHTSHIINKAIRYIITILGVTIALQNLGIEMAMFITAFGITGIVLSYGMKDIVANFIASILVLGYKHIKINDHIKIKDWQGTVIDINLRYTTLKHEDMIIFIPNILLYTQTVAILTK